MTSKFNIIISSDIDYNDLCAEIFFENQFVAILTQEEGFDNLEIQIHSPIKEKYWSFKFAEFEKALNSAKEILKEMQKSPEDSYDSQT